MAVIKVMPTGRSPGSVHLNALDRTSRVSALGDRVKVLFEHVQAHRIVHRHPNSVGDRWVA